ncbi:MAG: sigma-70 family RNA polymerase sigma factor [Planctomycetes bacterium]|nr:sigma-70 family RNA polymerase sigma factor [Planctomycetota bacterium]
MARKRVEREVLDAWVRSAQAGDRESFSLLVGAVGPILMRYFGIQGASPEQAEESVQETLVRLYTNLAEYACRSDFRTYALGVARNVHLESLRHRPGGAHSLQESDSSTESDALGDMVQEERKGEVREALARLAPRMREVLQLRFVEKLTCAEIAEILDTTVAAVSPLIYRAKRSLREDLHARDDA